MEEMLEMEFDRRPASLIFLVRGVLTSMRNLASLGFPSVRALWRKHPVDRRHLSAFQELAGLEDADRLPLTYPAVYGFPLHGAILTHRRFPLSILGSLQTRTQIFQLRPIPPSSELELEVRVAAHRMLEKGTEVDLHTELRADGEPAWESLTTYYYRGRFVTKISEGTDPAAPGATAPLVDGPVAASWSAPVRGGFGFGRLAGDFNPVHYSSLAARRQGFRGRFHHPHLPLAQALSRLGPLAIDGAHRLDLWVKGPVYYGAALQLIARREGAGTEFAMLVEGDERPAIVGKLRLADADGGRLQSGWGSGEM